MVSLELKLDVELGIGTVSPAELVVAKPAGPSVKTVLWSRPIAVAVVVGASVTVTVDPDASHEVMSSDSLVEEDRLVEQLVTASLVEGLTTTDEIEAGGATMAVLVMLTVVTCAVIVAVVVNEGTVTVLFT